MTRERRRFQRRELRTPVRFQWKDAAAGGLARDISERGLRMDLNEFIPIRTTMLVDVCLDSGKVQRFSGEVVWVEQKRFSERYQAGVALFPV